MKPLKFPQKLVPFKGVILFMTVLLLSNFFWKYNVHGDEESGLHSVITFWGINISAPFVWMARHVAHASETILQLLGYKIILNSENILRHANGNAVQVIWACTGLKQAYIYFCIIVFNRGPWLKKLWFIPLGLAVLYLFNIFRISFISGTIENHPEWFHTLHLYIFKYAYYALIFGMWVFWEEKIAGKITVKEATEQPSLT